jgi:signal transduction histidine kinase
MARVLLIERDAATRAALRRLLERGGFGVEESDSALGGLRRALTLPPDVILAGVRLPDLAAFELAARAKQDPVLRGVPFVALGEQGAPPSEHDLAVAAGADAYLATPVDPDRVADQVRAVLAGDRETLAPAEERLGLRAVSGALAAHLEAAVIGASAAAERLAESDRLRSAFMHDVTHELATPLTPLAGYLKILGSEKLGPLTPQQRRVLDSMSAAVTRLTRLIDNLSDFASLQAGGRALLTSPTDPDQLVQDVVDELRPAIRDARVRVEVRPSRGGPLQADPRKLRQALANVIGNAVKFSPHGGEVLVEAVREGGRLRISIYDQGPGLSAEDARRVFEPFFHAARARGVEARQPGSGLGLPVAKRIVEAHGGTITIECPPLFQPTGAPAQFTGCKLVLDLPAAEVRAEPARVSG